MTNNRYPEDFRVPSDVELEKLAIGTVLVFPDALEDFLSLRSDNFYSDTGKACYKAIKELVNEGETDWNEGGLNWIKFAEKTGLKNSNVSKLANEAISAAQMPSIVKSLQGLTKRRAMLKAAIEIQESVADRQADPDEMLSKALDYLEGAAVANAAEPVKIIDVVERRFDNLMGEEASSEGVGTGLIDLDDRWAGFFPGELTVLAARPSMGKTAFAQMLCVEVAQKTKEAVLMFSLEMSNDYLVDRYISSELEVDVDLLRRGQVGQKYLNDRYAKVMEHFAKLPIYLQDQTKVTTHDILAQARKVQRQEGLSLIVVDYLTLLADDREAGDSEHLKVQALTRRLRAIGKNLGVPVLVLAQLSREVERRPNNRPVLSDLRESGGIEEAADNVLFLYRDAYYNPESDDKSTEIIIAKQKQGPRGVTAAVYYQPDIGVFRNLAKGVA